MPKKVLTVGDHIRAARISRGLEQEQVASLLEVTASTVWNWENGHSSPPLHGCERIIEFLGYDPFPMALTFAERLVSFRRVKGLRVKDAAALAGVDPSSWSSWERSEHEITVQARVKVENVIKL